MSCQWTSGTRNANEMVNNVTAGDNLNNINPDDVGNRR
jgi:hypothetical protein